MVNDMKSNKNKIGKNTKILDHQGLLGEYHIGDDCIINNFVVIGDGVYIGNRCKIEAFSFIPSGIVIEDEVFVGPHVCFTNDRHPKSIGGWGMAPTIIRRRASIGANATILCGIIIGEGATVGAGAVVYEDVPPGVTVVGNPAKKIEL